jgi:nicotinate (nicotinamide) nucleotide adenylyltransferase
MMRRPVLAVLGGSFDPPHIGHVLIPTYLLTRGLASRVLVAPCWSHPFAKRMSPFLERLTLTRLAMAVHGSQVEVSDIELRLAESRDATTPSYSYELLQAIAAANPNYQVRLVVGSDIVADGEIQRWRNHEQLQAEFRPIVVPRMGYAEASSCALPEVSSTSVRGWLAAPDNPAARAGLEAAVPASVLARLREGIRGHVWLIGHGHVASHAEGWLLARGWTSTLISARGLVDGSEELPGMASRPSAAASGPVSRVPKAIWILCRDQHLGAVAKAVAGCGLRPVPVLHAAGSQPASEGLAPLAAAGFPVGTLHPICSLRKEQPHGMLDRACFGVEGDPKAREMALWLIGEQPWLDLQDQDAAQRTRYHAACALASNHLAVLFEASRATLTGQGHPAATVEQALAVLMRSALENLLALGVPRGVTGPVARGDMAAVARHVTALAGPAGELYALLSARLAEMLAAR